MKKVYWNGKELLLVEVPKMEEWDGCELRGRTGKNSLLSFYGTADAIELPDGNWQIAFASPLSPTEDEAENFVDSIFYYLILYKDYMALENGYEYDLDNPVESLHSRIRSEGFDPSRTVLLIKKPKT